MDQKGHTGLDSDLRYESVHVQERIWFTSHEYLACLINMHQDIMQECSLHGIHVHEVSDTSHTFLWDLPCQKGCPTALLCLHLFMWVRLQHNCSKHITHAGRNYKRDGINLWDLQRPLSSNKKYCPLHFFFFFLVSMSQGVSQKYLRYPELSFFWDQSQDLTIDVMHVKFSLSMKGWEEHKHFICHPKANSPKMESFTTRLQPQSSFFPPQIRWKLQPLCFL